MGNYWTSTAVDLDDGSRFINVTDNVLVFGSIGVKQPFGGAQLHYARNIHAYVGVGYHLFHPPDPKSWSFTNNTLLQSVDGDYGVNTVCEGPGATVLGGNAVSSPTAHVTECGESLEAWVAAGNDPGSTAGLYPSDEAVIAAAWGILEQALGE